MKRFSKSRSCRWGQHTAAWNVLFFTWDYSQQQSVWWLGLKIRMYRNMPEGISNWHHEWILCPASGSIPWWLWPAKGKVGVVTRPRQAHLELKVFLITGFMTKPQTRRWGAPKGQVRVVAGSALGKGGRDAGVRGTVWGRWTPGAGSHSLD